MLKRTDIGLRVVMFACAISLAGCGGEESLRNAVLGNDSLRTGVLGNENQRVGVLRDNSRRGGIFCDETLGEGASGDEISEGVFSEGKGPVEEIPESGMNAEEVSEKLAEETVLQYPKIAELPERWIDLVVYSEGCYCIYNDSFYGFMSEDGEEIVPYIYEQAFPFSEGLACVSLDGKYGYIGKDGETILPFIYDQASPFTDGLAYYRTGDEYGFIDHTGQVVLQPDCDSISSFQEGRAYFSVDGLYGYMDKTGEIIVSPIYEDAGYFRDGLAKVMRNGCYGVIGMEGEEILAPEYAEINIRDGFIMAAKDALTYCFDREGRQCLEEGWDRIDVQEGLFLVERDDGYGLFDRDGNVLVEPEYEWLKPIPGKDMAMAKSGGSYGVVDHKGNEKVPFIYQWISYDDSGAGGLQIMRDRSCEEGQEIIHDGYYGFLNITEEGGFEEIPAVYDQMLSFVEDRAVVCKDGKYGVIRRDGVMEIPMEYSGIRLFENGCMAIRTGTETELRDSGGKVIYSGTDTDIFACGTGYWIQKRGKYGLLNARGEQILLPVYDSAYSYDICGAVNILNMRQDAQSERNLLVKTEEGDGLAEPEIFRVRFLLQNHITPRVKEYLEFLQDGVIGVDGVGGDHPFDVNLGELEACRNFSKLYRMGEKGELVLYFYSEPYERSNFPMSDSGFFVCRNGQVEALLTGYECGGSARGDHICFWYDEKESRLCPGTREAAGGFGGFGYGGFVYELRDGGAELSGSYFSISQTSRNYSPEVLQENAELFYDNEDKPYTKETITDAESVTEYEANGKWTTVEEFEETRSRYRYMDALDLYF